jgi:outer membrane protein assembly factor BamB
MTTAVRFGSCVLPFSVGLCVLCVGVGVPAPLPKDKERTTPFVQWAAKKEFVSDGAHDPLVVGDKVILGTDLGELRAYRCKDGKRAWDHWHGARIYHRPSSDGERVYFSSAKGLTAVSAKDGKKVWSFDRAGCDGPTIVLPKQGLVCVGGEDGTLYAVSAKTGEENWKSDFITDAPPDRPNFPGANARGGNMKARPNALVSDGEAVFLSVFDQSRLVAVAAKTGKRLWAFQAGGWVSGSAVATAKHVFVGSKDKAFYCLDKKNGKQVWKFETGAQVATGGVVDGTYVYFCSCDGNLYCVSQADGKKRWHFATDRGEGGRPSAIYSVPILRGGSLYFAAGEGQAYAVDRETGKLKWKIRPSRGSELYCSPATDGALTFVVTRAAGKGRGEASLVAIGVK